MGMRPIEQNMPPRNPDGMLNQIPDPSDQIRCKTDHIGPYNCDLRLTVIQHQCPGVQLVVYRLRWPFARGKSAHRNAHRRRNIHL